MKLSVALARAAAENDNGAIAALAKRRLAWCGSVF
jgi:hypothetical protein